MTEDEKIELGGFCGSLLTHPHFNLLCEQFEKSYCQELLGTKPDQAAERERIYATYNGAKTFISFLGSVFHEAKAIAEANDPLADAEDEPKDIDY